MKRKNSKLRFWIFYHVGMLIISIGNAMFTKYKQTGSAFVPETILVASTIFILSIAIGYLAIFLANKGNKLPHDEFKRKIFPAFILFVVGAFIIANIVVSGGVFVWYLINGLDLNSFMANLWTKELRFANKGMFSSIFIFGLVFFFYLWQKSASDGQKLREENLKYKYRNLKSQVNPHFLFNSFNTLSELVYSDAKMADNYIQKLSGIYRYILENENTDLISLKEELEFVEQYFNLQKVRDTDKIFLDIDVQETAEYKIIPVSLQLLVENVFKHNSMSKEKPLVVKILKNENFLIVSNTLQRKNILGNSTKMGLSNLKERVKLILGRELVVGEESNQFVVKLPIIRVSK